VDIAFFGGKTCSTVTQRLVDLESV
jgi:hypothetical protein